MSRTSQISTLIFDFDGTIADTLETTHQILNQLSKRYRFQEITLEELHQLQNCHAREVLSFLKIRWYQLPFVLRAGKKELKEQIPFLAPFPHLKEILGQLKNEVKLGIVSSNSVENINLFLDKNQLHFFDFVVSKNTLFGKHHLLKKVLKEHQLSPQQAVYIGDEVRDIEAAQQAGIPSIAVTWGYNTRATLEKWNPDWIVDSPQQILQWLQNEL